MPCSSHPHHLHYGKLRGDVGVKSRAARCHHLRRNVLPHEFAASHSHVVVMQYVGKEVIDNYIAELFTLYTHTGKSAQIVTVRKR